MTETKLKTVAMIGRPNVGKSTLFNRLVGKRVAIETSVPGTTRDRLFGEVFWGKAKFNLIDVAGVEFGTKKEIDLSIQDGVQYAIKNTDVLLFLVDWNDKENEADRRVARFLRNSGKEVILVVNKVDNLERHNSIEEFKRLGNFKIFPVSAISGKSTGDLLDEIVKRLKKVKLVKEESKIKGPQVELAIIGRPNVGKSTLLNTIIGEKRAIVSSEAGTTRDTVNIDFMHAGKNIRIADTAGLRRPGKISKDTIESFSVIRTMSALKESDIAILVIDASEGLVALDINILGKAKEWGKGIILAVNKLDLIEGDQKEYMAKMIWDFQTKLNFAPWLPIVFISAQGDENVKALLSQAMKVYESRSTTIPQEDLTIILEDAKKSNPQLLDIIALVQKKANPPIFDAIYKGRDIPHYTQIRYLENKLRDEYPLSGSPIFIDLVAKPKGQSI
jgi:GTP-binding protein